MKQFQVIENREHKQRELAVEDGKFVNAEDGQWDDDARTKRANRPRYTINRTAPAIDQLVGDQRQSRTAVKINPVSSGADEDGAKLYGGLIRNIESQSKATNAYDQAYDETITGGYGGWRVLTEFNDDDSFEQDIKIKPIRSAATSLFFGQSQEYDKRDATHAFLISMMDIDEFKENHPDVSITDFSLEQYHKGYCSGWFRDNQIRTAEYWVKTPVMKEIALMSDGRVLDLGDEEKVIDELSAMGVTVVKKRSVKSHKVQMYKMNGAEIYEGPNDWAGKYIPLVPEFGKVSYVEDYEYVRGLTRNAKDPQRIYNYETSNAVETGALSPKDPIWITAHQAKGYTDELENFNVLNSPFMLYNSDPIAPGPPLRGGAPSVQVGQFQRIQQAENDLFMVTGMGPPAVGMNPGLQSGIALKRQDEKGDRGSYIFQDNHAKSIQYTGDILVDLLPKIFDTARIVRILHLDGSSETVEINQQSINDFNEPILDEETGEVVIVNDLSKGKYEASVETGPAFSTQREESASQLIELAQASPRFEELSTDLIAKNLNILESEELTKRIRKRMITEGLIDPTEEEVEEFGLNNQQPDPTKTAITDNLNMQTEKMISEIQLNDAKTSQTVINAQETAVQAYKDLINALTLQQEGGIPLGPDEHKLRKDTQAVIEVSQDQIAENA